MVGREKDAHERLQEAALKLFAERGFDQTTAAEIAALAGVTERTFFRYFPDKREVLFGGEAVLRGALLDALAAGPASLPPLDALLTTFRSVVPLFESNRPYSEPRGKVIAATPALRERELTKVAALVATLAEALERRGFERRLAGLAAHAGMAALNNAIAAWLNDGTLSLDACLVQAFEDLRVLATAMPRIVR